MDDYLREPIPDISRLVNQSETISTTIKAFFYSLDRDRKGRRVSPFIKVDGAYAYILLKERDILSEKLADESVQEYNDKDFEKYFKEYIGGFKYGYWHFEQDVLLPKATIFDNDENKRSAIFDYLMDNFKGAGRLTETRGSKEHIFSNWWYDGRKAGYYYRALYIVITDHRHFLPLFQERSQLKKETDESIKPKQEAEVAEPDKSINIDEKPPVKKKGEVKEEPSTPVSFDDLFKNPEHAKVAYQALVDAELMDENFKVIKKNLKTAFVSWVEFLISYDIINLTYAIDSIPLINKKIKALDLNKDSFRPDRFGVRAEPYKKEFKQKLSKLSGKK